MDTRTTTRKNPSREACEQIIQRILSVEVLEHGRNLHFRQASDFMGYFQSLYPPSDSLSKQVQRAIKSLHMPKDEQGFFIPNKTAQQVAQEKELKNLFAQSNTFLDDLEGCEPFFLKLDDSLYDYVIHLINSCKTFQNKYTTIVKASNGLIFYTRNKKQLMELIKTLL